MVGPAFYEDQRAVSKITHPHLCRPGVGRAAILMDLPKLSPVNATMPRPVASADAALLAQLALRESASQQMTAIVCADALDAQRLVQEMVFFCALAALRPVS